jgi:CAAX protease family protein
LLVLTIHSIAQETASRFWRSCGYNGLPVCNEAERSKTRHSTNFVEPPMSHALASTRSWQRSRLLAACEFAVVAALFVADMRHHVFFSKTPYLFVLAWVSLRLRSLQWKDIGLARLRGWGPMLAVGVLAGVGMELLELFVTQPLLVRIIGKMPDLSDLGSLRGNSKMLLLWLVLAWTLAAFGEEAVYRGYLMNRVAGLGNNSRTAWIVSLLLVSAVFGFSHLDQGITGQIENAINGLLLGLLYLGCGRNLWVPIIAHGITDTVDVTLLFMGKYPGM